jgi:hypothetical protein
MKIAVGDVVRVLVDERDSDLCEILGAGTLATVAENISARHC